MLALAAVLLAGAAPAQAAMPAFLSAAEVRALIAKAKQEIKPGEPMLSLPMAAADGSSVRLEYRQAIAPAAIHERDAELFYVIDGGGTLVTGGALVDGAPRPGGNLSGRSIDGGSPRRVGPGDVILVPAGTPHVFSAIDGTLILISVHMPTAAPAHP